MGEQGGEFSGAFRRGNRALQPLQEGLLSADFPCMPHCPPPSRLFTLFRSVPTFSASSPKLALKFRNPLFLYGYLYHDILTSSAILMQQDRGFEGPKIGTPSSPNEKDKFERFFARNPTTLLFLFSTFPFLPSRASPYPHLQSLVPSPFLLLLNTLALCSSPPGPTLLLVPTVSSTPLRRLRYFIIGTIRPLS